MPVIKETDKCTVTVEILKTDHAAIVAEAERQSREQGHKVTHREVIHQLIAHWQQMQARRWRRTKSRRNVMHDDLEKYIELARAFLPEGATATNEELQEAAIQAKDAILEFMSKEAKIYTTPQPLRRLDPDDELAETLGLKDK
jgi:hypothetical protein